MIEDRRNSKSEKEEQLLTKLMLESKLIWMYFQSNSIPLAPTHRGRHLKNHNEIQFGVHICGLTSFF